MALHSTLTHRQAEPYRSSFRVRKGVRATNKSSQGRGLAMRKRGRFRIADSRSEFGGLDSYPGHDYIRLDV